MRLRSFAIARILSVMPKVHAPVCDDELDAADTGGQSMEPTRDA